MVRPAEASDSWAVWDCHVRSIRDVCGPDYTPEQIAAWSGFAFDSERLPRSIREDAVWVWERDGRVAGFCHAKLVADGVGEVVGLYLAPEGCGTGGGRALIERAFAYFAERSVTRVRVKSTKTAREFYRHFGFVEVPGEGCVNLRGQRVECYPMEQVGGKLR